MDKKAGCITYFNEIKLAIWKVVVGGLLLAIITSFVTYVTVGVSDAKILRVDYDNHIATSQPLMLEHREAMKFITANATNIERIPQMDSLLRVVVGELKAIREIMEKRR